MVDIKDRIKENVRRLRKEKGMTLSEMATICECSSGLLSQIETGSVNPSLSTMVSISEALDTPFSDLFAGAPSAEGLAPNLMKPEERKKLTVEGGIEFQLLSRSIDVPFEFILNRFPPGMTTGKKLYHHEGTECGILLEGELEVETDGKIYEMKPGDTITLSSVTPHRLTNKGKKDALAIWVNSKAWCFSTK
jgi:transcriptional regulator with XRE-family HTH domain